MSKKRSRTRTRNKANGQATGHVKPTDGTVPPAAGNGGPPQGLHFSGPNRPPGGFHMGPPGFRAPSQPMGDPGLMMRERQMHGPGFHPGEFGGHPRFPYAQKDGRPPNFQHGPADFHGDCFVPPHLRDGPPGFIPPEFRSGPPGFVPPEFRAGPPGFVPPEFRAGPPGFVPPEFRAGPPGFVPPEFRAGPPGFVPPELMAGPPGSDPPEFRAGPPGSDPPEFRTGPPGSVPPDFRTGPPGSVPPEFRAGPPGSVPPEFRAGPPGFIPPEFRVGPPGFIPPEFRNGPPGFIPPGFGSGPPGFIPPEFTDISGQPEMGPSQGPVVDCASTDPSTSSHLPQVQGNDVTSVSTDSPQQPPVQTTSGTDGTNETKNGNTKIKTLSAVTKGPVIRSMVEPAKPPAGRSVGVITFIGPDYGVIEREDTKTYRFSFEAFFGNRKHLLPDVKVHFTAVKVMGNECAADVKVAPGGTEHIETTVYEGVVTKVIPDTYVLEPHPGRIRTILVDEPIKLPFGKMDTRATLLLFDRVKFQVLGDLILQTKRATNITPQMPETIQLTKEVRLTGVIMGINNETCTIMSKTNQEFTGSVNEHLSDGDLKVMDDVEFTTKTVNAGRGSKVDTVKAIRIKKLHKPEETDKIKSKWKPVISKDKADEVEVDNIASSDTYDGTIFKVIPKKSTKEVKQGLVKFTVDGTDKRLPFGPDGVITQATMLIGDMVQFNIATNPDTKEDHAINVTVKPESFQTQLMEQRKSGVLLKLNENNGTIGAAQESLVVFDTSEVMDSKLTVSDKVEFTLVVSAEGKRAIRITRPNLREPKVEEKKEKKKIQMDLKEQIKNEVKDPEMTDSQTDENQKEDQRRSRSQERSRRRHSRSSSRSRESSYRRRRSSSRDRSYRSHRRSRSRSHDRSHRRSRSRSRSWERYSRNDQKRSCSPNYRGEHHSRRRSRNPDLKSKAFDSQIVEELVKKREELLELNELIARKKAIIAMEQTNLFIDEPEEFIYEYQNQRIPDVKRVKSILKKPVDSCASFQHQVNKGSSSTMELVEYPKITPSIYTLASSSPENEDPELARKKRQLQELNESIARKRAIIAMEQKVKVMKKEYDPPSFLSHYDEDPTDESTWDPDIKPENTWDLNIKPKKSILKKRSEDQPQREMTSTNQFDCGQDPFQGSKSPPDDCSAPSNLSNLPSMPTNTFNYFKSLIDAVSSGSRTSKSSHFIKTSGLQPMPSTSYSQTSPFSQEEYSQASTTKEPLVHSSAVKQKSNLSKQMERFLGALNKADSNMLSSLLDESNSDSKDLKNQRNQQHKKEPSKEELYDPFSETNDNGDFPFMGSKECKIPMLGNFQDLVDDYGQEDLLPHERAVEDGRGFSRIVGMTYGTDSNPENQKSSRFYKDNPFLQVHVSYPEGSQRYDEEKESKALIVQRSFSPVSQKSDHTSEEVDDGQYKKLQDLLQTIGLNLDTTEVTKLADRTRERLYGKKANPQTTLSDSADQKDKRRASEQSNDTDTGACSTSPAKSSKREVYMSYSDSIKSHLDKAAGDERDLVSLTRTIRNSPEAKQASPDSSRVNEETNCYNPIPPSLSSFQSAGSLYSQTAIEPISAEQYHNNNQALWGSGYTLPIDQIQTSAHMTPYDAQPPGPYYAPSYPSQHYYPPPGYGTYTPPVNVVHHNPVPHFPPPTFTMPGPFAPFPNSSYPPFTESSDFPAQQIKVKSTPTNRCLKTIETQNNHKVKKTTRSTSTTDVQMIETLPKEDKSEAECQFVSTTEDVIKGKLKKRLEQFNQRMRLKKKLKMEAQKTPGQGQQSTPGQVTDTEVKNVWICGHSLVFWAKKRATSPEVGMQLGMDRNTVRIWWKGVQGMKWQQLLPQLLQLKGNWAKPDIILIHLGGNDIGTTSPEAFVEAVKNDFVSLKSVFPQCLLVWSDILPRKSWRHSDNSLEVNDIRDAINEQIHGIMEELGGSSLTHENITPTLDSCLYRPDGVHLSGRGIDTFNLNMQDFLEKWESKISQTESAEA